MSQLDMSLKAVASSLAWVTVFMSRLDMSLKAVASSLAWVTVRAGDVRAGTYKVSNTRQGLWCLTQGKHHTYDLAVSI